MVNKSAVPTSSFRWSYPKQDPSLLAFLVKELHLHPIAAQICIARGFQSLEDVRDFLYPHVSNLCFVERFPELDKAVQRLLLAKERGETVMVYGDSDVDGMTGVALLVEFLRAIGIAVEYCFLGALLKQHKEISSLISKMKEKQVSLLITVDCGITAGKEVGDINKHGIDVIVTDHHMPTGRIPYCVATLNPKLKECHLKNKELTGVGVAFKLAAAVFFALSSQDPQWRGQIQLSHFLDLVSLGTVTDVGILLDENRVMVRHGIQEMSKGRRLGLRKLCSMAGVNRTEVTSTDIVLKIAPKLNSLGRLSDPGKGVELLLTQDPQTADRIIRELDQINKDRQKIEAEVFKDIQKILTANPSIVESAAIVISSPNWHSRIIPIISARLAKTYNKPVAIISTQEGIGKGSLRTISSFPLLGMLQKCSSLFVSYGGHDFAAGIIIKEEKIEDFRKKFVHLAQSSLKKEDFVPTLALDAQADFASLDHDLLASLDLFEPFGKGNQTPTFYTTVRQIRYPKLLPGNHIKLYLNQGERNLEGIAFSMGDRIHTLRAGWNLPLELAYAPRVSRSSLGGGIHLLVKDFKVLSPSFE